MNTKLLQEALEMLNRANVRISAFKATNELNAEATREIGKLQGRLLDVFDDLYDVAKEMDYEEVMKAIPF